MVDGKIKKHKFPRVKMVGVSIKFALVLCSCAIRFNKSNQIMFEDPISWNASRQDITNVWAPWQPNALSSTILKKQTHLIYVYCTAGDGLITNF